MKAISILLSTAGMIGAGYYAMVYGWGLTVHSWPSIIVPYLTVVALQMIIEALRQ